MLTLDSLAKLDGLITDDVGEMLYAYAAEVPAELAVVEIGAYRGKSTCYLAAGRAAGHGGQVYSVDAWSTDVQEWSRHIPSVSVDEWRSQVGNAGYASVTTAIQGRSVDIAGTWPMANIGLLYIDGDHSYAAVQADYRVWRRHLAPDAAVIFDDYGVSRNPDVAPAVHDLMKLGELPDITVLANGRLAVARVVPDGTLAE